MSKVVEFFYDVVSPYSYLAFTQIGRLEALGQVEYKPFLIGGVFKASSNVMPAANPAKGQYMFRDLKKLAAYYGVELRFPSTFPTNSLQAMRCITALQGQARLDATAKLFRAYWVDNQNIGDEAVLAELLGAEVLAQAADENVKAALKANTENAASRGAFGAPTFFLGDDMYFGEDRIFLIEHALKG